MTKIFTVTKALQDAGLPYSAIEQAAVGYVYGKTSLLQMLYMLLYCACMAGITSAKRVIVSNDRKPASVYRPLKL